MEKIGNDILKLEVKKQLQMLNEALCDEWLTDLTILKEEIKKISLYK